MSKNSNEYDRKYYAKRTAHIERRICPLCGKRVYSKQRDICQACWLKTDDGREYLRLKKIESRSKRNHEQRH
jgi:ribosomal protein L37E